MYLARDLCRRAQPTRMRTSFSMWVTLPFEELVRRVMDGSIQDAKTVATALKAKILLNR